MHSVGYNGKVVASYPTGCMKFFSLIGHVNHASQRLSKMQSNLDDFQVMSKIINAQNASREFKFTITKHTTNSKANFKFQDTVFRTSEEKFAFTENESVNCLLDYDETTSCIIENSHVSQDIYNKNETYITNPDVENHKNDDFKILESTEEKHIERKTETTLKTLSVKELRLLAADLAQIVNDVSNKLVSLLQENDTLRQESDARNIAIEQLLKLTVKQAETDLRPIKMSVITSNDGGDDEWD